MITSALYYPYWKISDASFLSSSLLLWDSLYCIAPNKSFTPWFDTKDPELAEALHEAHAKFVPTYVPNIQEKTELHTVALGLVETVPFNALSVALSPLRDPWEISARKMSEETIELLLNSGWATRGENQDAIALPEAIALILMSELANICTGPEMCSVTDIRESCRLAMRLLTWPPLAEAPSEALNTDEALLRLAIPRLVPKSKDGEPLSITLKKILKARENLACEELRRRFRDKVQGYLVTVRNAKSTLEMQAIVDGFSTDLDHDAALLQKELRSVALEAVIPKDGIAGVLIGAGVFLAGTVSVGAGGVLGLAGIWRGYRKERQKILRDHWTSFLFGLEHQNFSVW